MPKSLKNLFGLLPQRRDPPENKDDAVRRVLAERGDTGETARETTFYFYDGDFEGLATAASTSGYRTELTVKNDGVILTRVVSVDAASFDPINKQMEAWAEEFGCEYDGWETMLEAKPN